MKDTSITEQIRLLKIERDNIKGTPCEVYSRVVGYLRPVGGWNVAKKEEFKIRKLYNTTLPKEGICTSLKKKSQS